MSRVEPGLTCSGEVGGLDASPSCLQDRCQQSFKACKVGVRRATGSAVPTRHRDIADAARGCGQSPLGRLRGRVGPFGQAPPALPAGAHRPEVCALGEYLGDPPYQSSEVRTPAQIAKNVEHSSVELAPEAPFICRPDQEVGQALVPARAGENLVGDAFDRRAIPCGVSLGGFEVSRPGNRAHRLVQQGCAGRTESPRSQQFAARAGHVQNLSMISDTIMASSNPSRATLRGVHSWASVDRSRSNTPSLVRPKLRSRRWSMPFVEVSLVRHTKEMRPVRSRGLETTTTGRVSCWSGG